MTKFNKSDFDYHGGYLHYTGTYDNAEVWPAITKGGTKVHPSRVGKQKPLFIARFKHRGPFTKAKFLAQLIKNFTVEEYVEARNQDGLDSSPLQILRNKNEDWYYKVLFDFKAKQEARRGYTSPHCAYDYA